MGGQTKSEVNRAKSIQRQLRDKEIAEQGIKTIMYIYNKSKSMKTKQAIMNLVNNSDNNKI